MLGEDLLMAELDRTPLAPWAGPLVAEVLQRLSPERHGDLPRWKAALAALPDLPAHRIDLDAAAVSVSAGETPEPMRDALEQALAELHPWRKGPFDLHGVHIDTEWRSDLKWDRVRPGLDDLSGRCVLDIGSGNGYFGWRMLGAGAERVIGIDPTLVFVMQHLAVQHCLQLHGNRVLPLGIEDLPAELSGFDTVFSMGVLYHRRSPIHHLERLHSLLRPGGQLVLETLVIDGDAHTALVPEGRYARMRNVWFLPSTTQLERWLGRCGFRDIATIDVTRTTVDEQRSTDWMRFESLAECLDREDPSRTIEGYPGPVRAALTARRPGRRSRN